MHQFVSVYCASICPGLAFDFAAYVAFHRLTFGDGDGEYSVLNFKISIPYFQSFKNRTRISLESFFLSLKKTRISEICISVYICH